MAESIPSFAPIHSAHSIEEACFTVKFSERLGAEQLRRAAEVARERFGKDELPGFSQTQDIELMIGPSGTIPKRSVGGFALQRFQRNGNLDVEFVIDSSGLSFRTFVYDRWKSTLDSGVRYFEACIAFFLSSAPVASISLSYVDKFLYNGDMKLPVAPLALKRGSPFVPDYLFDCTDYWHCHTGAFSRNDEQTKRLLNVNLDLIEEHTADGSRKVLAVRSIHTDIFGQESFLKLDIMDENQTITFIDEHLNSLHDLHKSMLSRTLSEELAKRIQLTAPSK
jgi:uncharacterized protein (TIGR04255 family)